MNIEMRTTCDVLGLLLRALHKITITNFISDRGVSLRLTPYCNDNKMAVRCYRQCEDVYQIVSSV
jgi:hypothetical protein